MQKSYKMLPIKQHSHLGKTNKNSLNVNIIKSETTLCFYLTCWDPDLINLDNLL